jgi:hypothetical protein
MNKDTLKTHALMLLNMYGVKEKDIKDRPECLNVFLNEVKEIREQAIKERDGYWKDIIMKKLYNMDTCNDVNEIFNLMDKLKK